MDEYNVKHEIEDKKEANPRQLLPNRSNLLFQLQLRDEQQQARLRRKIKVETDSNITILANNDNKTDIISMTNQTASIETAKTNISNIEDTNLTFSDNNNEVVSLKNEISKVLEEEEETEEGNGEKSISEENNQDDFDESIYINITAMPSISPTFTPTTSFPTQSPTLIYKTYSPTLNHAEVDEAVAVVLDATNHTENRNDTTIGEAVDKLISQGYVFTASPYEPSGWSEIWACVITSLLIFLIPGFFQLISHLRTERRVTGILQGLVVFCGMVGKVFTKFAFPLSRRDRDLERLGVEGAAVLLLERELGLILLAMAFITNIVLVPIHSSFATSEGVNLLGEGRRKSADFVKWTIQNVPVQSSYYVLWVHVGFVYLLTWIVLQFSYTLSQHLRYLEKSNSTKLCIFVEGTIAFFPCSESDLKRAFEIVIPGQVESVRIFDQRFRSGGGSSVGEFRCLLTFFRQEDSLQFLSRRNRKLNLKRVYEELIKKGSKEIEEDSEGEGESVKLLTQSSLKFLISLKIDKWNVELAPVSGDIMWKSISTPWLTFILRSICVNGIIVLALFIFTTPIAFITFASGVTSPYLKSEIQTGYSTFVGNLRKVSPGLGDFLFGFLPQAFLVICDAWLLFVLQLASKIVEPHHTHSGREKSLFRKSFWFLMFNTLLLPSLALSNIGALIGDLFQNETSPFALLGKAFVTSSGAFTLTFVATQTWVGAAMDVGRITERCWFITRRPDGKFEYDYGSEYALGLTMFSLCLVFSTVVPPILFFGVSYFIVKQAVDDYCLRHLIARQEIDLLPKAYVAREAVPGYLIISIILFQSSIFGFFSSEVCLPTKYVLEAGHELQQEIPCIGNEYSGVLVVRGSYFQLLALLICFVVTCVIGLLDIINRKYLIRE